MLHADGLKQIVRGKREENYMKLKKSIIKVFLFLLYLIYIFAFLEAIGYPSDIWDKISKGVDNRYKSKVRAEE